MTERVDPATAREALKPRKTGRAAQLESSQLRPGWTTGACAAAAATAAWTALNTGEFPDPVEIELPGGKRPGFALTQERLDPELAMAAITKDAGDDPDVTHGAVIRVTVARGTPGSGIEFRGGPGVGTVTAPGLPLAVGEPAINPVPRRYLSENLQAVSAKLGLASTDAVVTVSVDNGEQIAEKTWNSRIGILGGLSILGTTGVVVPYSCSAWIASIQRGIDVAVATGATHAAACTGSTSERIAQEQYPEITLLDMGDFAGAVLKYLRRHPIPRLTICGGVAKLSKLAAGHLDLHSHRTKTDMGFLAELVGPEPELQTAILAANTVAHAVTLADEAGINLAQAIAEAARTESLAVLEGAPVEVEVICIDRAGKILGRTTSG